MTDIDGRDAIEASRERWREVRRALDAGRHELSTWAARTLYADHPRAGATDLLTRAAWVPPGPVPWDCVRLRWCEALPGGSVDGTEPQSAAVRPLRADGTRYETYSSAVGELARPRLFEDRPCYRLLGVVLEDGGVELSFGPGHYFGTIDTCEAAAHELAEAHRGDPAARTRPAVPVADRRPLRPRPTPGDRGAERADAPPIGDGRHLRAPPPGQRQGRSRRGAVPGHAGRRLPAHRPGGGQPGERLRPVAVPGPGVRARSSSASPSTAATTARSTTSAGPSSGPWRRDVRPGPSPPTGSDSAPTP